MPADHATTNRLPVLAGLVGVALVLWLGWSNWDLRQQVQQLTQQQDGLAQRLQFTQKLYDQALARPAQGDCPAPAVTPLAPGPSGTAAAHRPGAPASGTAAGTTESEGVVHIPPGADLREALQIIQREQAKKMGAEPGSAGFNPFGAAR